MVNHHGAIDNAEFLQHGGRGGIAVMNVKKMIESKNDNTAAALERHLDTGHFGAVGLVLLPDLEDAVRGGHRDGRRQRPVRAGAGRTEQ